MENVTNSTSLSGSETAGIVLLFLFIGFCIFMYIKTSKAQKKVRTQLQENMKNKNASFSITIPHLMGLSIPENSFTTIYVCPNSYEFESNGVTFSLNKEKITDVSLKTNTEIQKQVVSSVGGAVGGAVLFGPLGAMIGGRAKTKELRTVTTCLIFTYEKENNIDYVAFNASNNLANASKLVKDFQSNNFSKEKKKIEL